MFEEYDGNIQTVMCKQHPELGHYFSTLWAWTEKPMWLWNIHGDQMTIRENEEKYLATLFQPKEQKDFSINEFVGGN